MKSGDKVRCVDAKDVGIPISEGSIYTIAEVEIIKAEDTDRPELIGATGVYLEEVQGFYRSSRFEVIA